MIPTTPDFKKLFIVALVSLLTACGGSEERKAKYMVEGKQLFASGDYQKAQLSFKNVLQIDPKDIEVISCTFLRQRSVNNSFLNNQFKFKQDFIYDTKNTRFEKIAYCGPAQSTNRLRRF